MQDSKVQYDQEKDAYNTFCHENILKVVECVDEFKYMSSKGNLKDCSAVIMEYATKGDLFSFIQGQDPFEEKYIRFMLRQLLAGLDHIHENGFAHLDLKLENVYLDDQFVIKIADFGLSKQMTSRLFDAKRIGSRGYMAPEILESKPFSGTAVDIFALGVLLYTLRAKELPFGQARLSDCWYRLLGNQQFNLFWDYHERKNNIKFSEELRDLLNALFEYEPEQRPTLEQISNSQFLQGETCTSEEFFAEMARRSEKVNP